MLSRQGCCKVLWHVLQRSSGPGYGRVPSLSSSSAGRVLSSWSGTGEFISSCLASQTHWQPVELASTEWNDWNSNLGGRIGETASRRRTTRGSRGSRGGFTWQFKIAFRQVFDKNRFHYAHKKFPFPVYPRPSPCPLWFCFRVKNIRSICHWYPTGRSMIFYCILECMFLMLCMRKTEVWILFEYCNEDQIC